MSSSSDNNVSRQESLTESWIEVGGIRTQVQNLSHEGSSNSSEAAAAAPSPIKTTTVNNGALEKLLLEAQRESSKASSCIESVASSSRGSPRSQHSPTNSDVKGETEGRGVEDAVSNEVDPAAAAGDWVWDWSSRPEVVQSGIGEHQFRHPVTKRRNLSVRNTRLMHGIVFCLENLPLLIFSHACTFIVGAASMLVYLKKYGNWSPVGQASSVPSSSL